MRHFRMIGLVDVSIEYKYGIERVTLPFYSSSGTNNGKIKGLWYPIIGIKTESGPFNEFTEYLNFVLTNTTYGSQAQKGWLAKSIFFYGSQYNTNRINGFTNGRYYSSLLVIGNTLRDLYTQENYYKMQSLNSHTLNEIVTSKDIYPGNKYSQRENFEKLIQDIFNEIF